MLNFIWAGFIVTALFAACWQAIATGDGAVFGVMTKAMFDSAKTGFEISIGLTGDYLWRSSAKIGAGKFRPLRPLQPA